MGNKDITEKLLEDYADVFADIINVLLLDGNEVISPANLLDAVKQSMYKADGDIHPQERDNAKYWDVNGVRIALIGIENQSSVDNYMPLRVIGYDGASYRKQIKDHEDIRRKNKDLPDDKKHPIPPIYPVLTHVLYFGEQHWDEMHKSLKNCFDKDNVFADFINDYKITVTEIQYLSDETVHKFKSDFRFVAELFTQYRKVREGKLDKISISIEEAIHAEEVMNLLSTMIGDKDFSDACKHVLEKGGNYDMIPVFETMKEQAKREGRAEGIAEGVTKGKKEAYEEIAKELIKNGVSLEIVQASIPDLAKAESQTPSGEDDKDQK